MKKIFMVVLCLLAMVGCSAGTGDSKEIIGEDIAILPMSNDLMFRQTGYDCAAHAVFAIVSGVDSSSRNKETLDKIKADLSGYTEGVHPLVIIQLLSEYGVTGEISFLSVLNAQEKIEFLETELKNRNRVILLVTTQDDLKLLHYITLVSFAGCNKYIYDSYDPTSDSIYVTDHNGFFPGNKTLIDNDLLTWWETGRQGDYSYIAITTSGGDNNEK